jgi:hypothetical protein
LSPKKRRPSKLAKAKPTPLAFAQVVVHPSTTEPLRLRFSGQRELILPASMSIEQVADRRIHGTIKRQVKEVFEQKEKSALSPLPPAGSRERHWTCSRMHKSSSVVPVAAIPPI